MRVCTKEQREAKEWLDKNEVIHPLLFSVKCQNCKGEFVREPIYRHWYIKNDYGYKEYHCVSCAEEVGLTKQREECLKLIPNNKSDFRPSYLFTAFVLTSAALLLTGIAVNWNLFVVGLGCLTGFGILLALLLVVPITKKLVKLLILVAAGVQKSFSWMDKVYDLAMAEEEETED